MTDDLQINLRYRSAVLENCIYFKSSGNSPSQDEIFQYLEATYQSEKEILKGLIRKTALEHEILAQRYAVFVLSVGLFTFGRLDVVCDILQGIPPSGGIRQLVLVLDALLPLPANFSALEHGEKFIQWFERYRNQLSWDGVHGVFIKK